VAWSQRVGETARIGRALLAEEQQLFRSWYRVRDGTLAGADFQVAMLSLMARVHTLLQEGAAGADAKAHGPTVYHQGSPGVACRTYSYLAAD
jgi:hypothetical protein